MSRFEKEVLSVPSNTHLMSQSSANLPGAAGSVPSLPLHFIPHQIQRQLPTQRPPTQATFVTMSGGHSSVGSSGGNHGIGSNITGKSNLGGQSSSQVNYTVTPMQVPAVVHNVPSSNNTNTKPKSKNQDKGKKKKKVLRMAGGQVWEDPSLTEWDPNDFRIFCGDLGNDVTDDVLTRSFNRFNSFVKAKVVRDKRTNKSRGYGFVSFKDPQDFARAIKEMNGKYVGSRPIKLRKSCWKDRNLDVVKKKHKAKAKLGLV
ncbi:hypothetical protein RDWZM_000102 [Blomia tropicalis]|uniref:RNA-binding protein 42 n=1 Tax=Blomia tropicalis TaxID=40697 RepID=A0A9Q0M9H4_BLOTA|nr:hypothetical protein RDWZM_000102 [Blomia tropicalis]